MTEVVVSLVLLIVVVGFWLWLIYDRIVWLRRLAKIERSLRRLERGR